MAVSNARHLLERDFELADLGRDAEAAGAGRGRLVWIEGPAGIGKTELLTAARAVAESAGLAAASARGAELERDFAFGVVRQLFIPLLRGCDRPARERLLSGPAARAREVFFAGDGVPATADQLSEIFHGLHWLTLNIAEQCPLLMSIDDAQWADESSLRFLSYLAGRLEGMPVLTLVTVRSDARSHQALATVAREPATRHVKLKPLTLSSVHELVRQEYSDGAVAPEFSKACLEASGGNPFLLRELVRGLHRDAISPTAEQSHRVPREGAETVARAVLTRIAGISPEAVTVARALAILGGEADGRDIAELSSLDVDTVADSLDRLADAELVAGADPVGFTHPIVQASIYADIPAGQRGQEHRRAARILADRDVPAERVAAHLLLTAPAGAPSAAGILIRAAEEALARGAPDSAVAYLSRAYSEPPALSERHKTVTLLGRAKYLAHRPGASRDLIEAMDSAETAMEHGELALAAAKALVMGEPDRSEDAIQILDRAITELADRDSPLSMRLEAELLMAAGLKLSTRPVHAARLEAVYRRPLGDDPAVRLLLGNLAAWTLLDGRTPGRFAELARHAPQATSPADLARLVAERALADGQLLREQGPDSALFYLPIIALYVGDFLERAEHWLDEAIAESRRRGSALGYAEASATQAEVAYRKGDLRTAEAHALAAAAISRADVQAVLANILIEQDRLDEAQRVLHPDPLPGETDHLLLQPIRAAAARLRVAHGQLRAGADGLLACGAWLDAWPMRNPGMIPWRSAAALALVRVDEGERAGRLAQNEVDYARALGQPRSLGIALRARALCQQGSAAIDLLREAIVVLEQSPARLEHARALVDYGALLRRAGHRTDARAPLRDGLDLAGRCGAITMTRRARQELLATGARPRRMAVSGRDSLTPTEARVAELAAQGHSTPEIAQALFVTPKTVETHLGHVYRKLGIHSRTELAPALSKGSDRPVTAL